MVLNYLAEYSWALSRCCSVVVLGFPVRCTAGAWEFVFEAVSKAPLAVSAYFTALGPGVGQRRSGFLDRHKARERKVVVAVVGAVVGVGVVLGVIFTLLKALEGP